MKQSGFNKILWSDEKSPASVFVSEDIRLPQQCLLFNSRRLLLSHLSWQQLDLGWTLLLRAALKSSRPAPATSWALQVTSGPGDTHRKLPQKQYLGRIADSAGAVSRPDWSGEGSIEQEREEKSDAEVASSFLPQPLAMFTEVRSQAPTNFRDSRGRVWALHHPNRLSECSCPEHSSMVPNPLLLAAGLGTWWPAATGKSKKSRVRSHHWVWAGGNQCTYLQGGV